MDKQITIHVGTHKTGSTFLQEKVFGNLSGVRAYLHGDQEIVAPLLANALGNLLFSDLDELARRVRETIASRPENKVVISHEDLSGYFFASYVNNKVVTDILKRIFPDARIILVIRRQDSFIESAYRETLKAGLSIPVRYFVGTVGDNGFPRRRPSMKWPKLNVSWLDWERYVANYVATFGRDNVLVLPFEMLKEDRKAFLDAIFAFLDVEPFYPEDALPDNRGYSKLSARLAYVLNRFVRNDVNPTGIIKEHPFHRELKFKDTNSPLVRLGLWLSRELSLRHFLENRLDRLFYAKGELISPEIKKRILDEHRQSNERIEAEYGIPLKRFGYW